MLNLLRGPKFKIFKRFLQTKSIKSVLDSEQLDLNIRVIGWVKNFRNQKEVKFIHINDGTDPRNLQLVVTGENLKHPDELDKVINSIHFNTSLEAKGKLVKSTHKHQNHELQVTELNILTECDPSEYPFKPKVKQTLESIRPYVHLRSHVDQFSSIMKFRSEIVFNIHKYFHEHEFTQIHTPVITSNNCEGGCETFEVTLNEQDHGLKNINNNESKNFFSKPVYLTASAQLHLEAMTTGLGNVYTLSPTFRAEKSMTRHHLAEFYMLEAEMIGMDSLDKILDFTEDFLKTISIKTYKSIQEPELYKIFNRNKCSNMELEYIKNTCSYMNDKKFIRITYKEAIDVLNKLLGKKKYAKMTKKSIEFGEDLNKEQEKLLVEYFQNVPVFVTKYPKNIKPFYMRQSKEDETLVDNFDLLVPNVGEIIGGSLREYRLDLLKNAIVKQNLEPKVFDLYLETKRFGAMKLGGWGLGLERLIQFLVNIENIRDCCAFPRSLNNCKM